MIIVITVIPATLLSLTIEKHSSEIDSEYKNNIIIGDVEDYTKDRKLYDRLVTINLSILYYIAIYIFLLVKLWNLRNKISDYKIWLFQGFVGLLMTMAHLSAYMIVKNYDDSQQPIITSTLAFTVILAKERKLIYVCFLMIPIWVISVIALMNYSGRVGGWMCSSKSYRCTAGSQQDPLSSSEGGEICDYVEVSTKIMTSSSSSLLPEAAKLQEQNYNEIIRVPHYGSMRSTIITD
ncbi:10251_t:CDS:1, partial [Ambispora gerdemannii]